MPQTLTKEIRAYLAGFLDGDGSVYVRAKPNQSYRFGYQIAPNIVLFQSSQEREKFEMLCSCIGFGYMRERKDGVLEYIIGKKEDILSFIALVRPYVILKKEQLSLMEHILKQKEKVNSEKDFQNLLDMIDLFRDLNYSKKRKRRVLTP
jgi:hypothetical protein